jgi:hypothetical protein
VRGVTSAPCPDCDHDVETRSPSSRADVRRLRAHDRTTGETASSSSLWPTSQLCKGSWKFVRAVALAVLVVAAAACGGPSVMPELEQLDGGVVDAGPACEPCPGASAVVVVPGAGFECDCPHDPTSDAGRDGLWFGGEVPRAAELACYGAQQLWAGFVLGGGCRL